MNRERRKILAGIFADMAKYTLTGGVIGTIIGGKFSLLTALLLGLLTGIFCVLAYFVTPKDKDDKDKKKKEN
jgi:hypothetical protein